MEDKTLAVMRSKLDQIQAGVTHYLRLLTAKEQEQILADIHKLPQSLQMCGMLGFWYAKVALEAEKDIGEV